MRYATLAFSIRALTSSSVPPLLLIMLPRYLKESVSSSGSSPSVNGLLFFVLAFMILVLILLMLSPVCVDTVFRSSVFFLHLLVTVGQESKVICKINCEEAHLFPICKTWLSYLVGPKTTQIYHT